VPLLELREAGLYCPAGRFYIDPSGPVDRAIVTHAHGDHARPGSDAYLTTRDGETVLRARLGDGARVEAVEYGERVAMGDAIVSLHPAGHILGSAQVRIEQGGEVWVVSGDYKRAADPTCQAYEPRRCHTFVTESTFGLPIFRWPEAGTAMEAIEAWWSANRQAGKASVLFADALGKAQRILAELDGADWPIYAHAAVERFNRLYRERGVALRPTPAPAEDWRSALILAPPSCQSSGWMRRFPGASTALASGWMRIRGTRRRRSLDRGFVLSDHADWPALLRTIDESGAETVWVTHGFRAPLARWLEEHGRAARAVDVQFEDGREEPECDS